MRKKRDLDLRKQNIAIWEEQEELNWIDESFPPGLSGRKLARKLAGEVGLGFERTRQYVMTSLRIMEATNVVHRVGEPNSKTGYWELS